MIQKMFATLLTYSISLQLILGGIPVAMLTSNTAFALECPEGLEPNAILGRCLSSRQAAQVQAASSRCQRITDKAAQNRCYSSALLAQVKEGEDSKKIGGADKVASNKWQSQVMIILSMAALISGVMTLRYLKGDCKGATSAWLMAGAAASVFAGEVMSGMKFQSKAREAFEDFKKIKDGTSEAVGSEVQSEALAAMIKREQAVIDAAGMKKTFYSVATAAYAAAGVMAILEARKFEIMAAQVQAGGPETAKLVFFCVKAGTTSSTEGQATIEASAKTASGAANATVNGLSSVSGFGSIGTGTVAGTNVAALTTAATAGSFGGWGLAGIGAGAIGGSMLLSGGFSNGGDNHAFNLSSPRNNSNSSPSNNTSGSGGGGGSPSNDGNNDNNSGDDNIRLDRPGICSGGEECESSIDVKKLSTEQYLVAFFEKNQKIKYDDFYNTTYLNAAEDISTLYQLSSELKRFRDGELFSSTIEDFNFTKQAALDIESETTHEDFSLMKLATMIGQQFSVQQAHGSDLLKGIGMILGMGGIGVAGALALAKGSSKLTLKFISPYSRATLSGTLAVVNAFMIGHIGKQQKEAKKRKEFMENLQLQVEAAGTAFGSCTAEQRSSDMSKPHCFCYLEGGAINTTRVKSATCKAFFGAGLARNVNRPSRETNAREPQSCTTPNATVLDESCSCRRTNTCTTIPRATFTSTGVAPSAIGGVNDTIDALNNGKLDINSINPDDMLLRAAALGKRQQALLKDPKNKAILDKIKKSDKDGAATMRSLATQFASSPQLMNSNLGNLGGGSMGSSGTPQEQIKKLQEEFKKDMGQYEPGSIGGGGSKLGAAEDDFSLDALSGGVTVEDEKLAEVMDTNFEATGSDINSNSDANIFQILTYRYQRSAMRRLFGGESILPADKPNETEIAE